MHKNNPLFDVSGRTVQGKINGLVLNHKAIVMEFLAMAIFIYTGCGSAVIYSAPPEFKFDMQPERMSFYQVHADSTVGIFVPLVFGTIVMIISFAVSRLSAGQLNPAVTIGLYAARKQNLIQSVGLILAQFCGSLVGIALLAITLPNSAQSQYAATMIMPGVGVGNALAGEIIMTSILMFVILETSVSKFGGLSGPISMGFTVFVAHGVLLPIDGCSLNPARSLGPAVWSGKWDDFWIFVVGPIAGALLAVPIHFYSQLAPSVLDFSPPDKKTQFMQSKTRQNNQVPNGSANRSEL